MQNIDDGGGMKMRAGHLWPTAMTAALLTLVAACTSGKTQNGRTAPASISSARGSTTGRPGSTSATTTSVTSAELFDDYYRTLHTGPTRFTLVRHGGVPNLVVDDGVVDLRADAVDYADFFGAGTTIFLATGGAEYECPTAQLKVAWHCDPSHKWDEWPKAAPLGMVSGLEKRLVVPPSLAAPGSPRVSARSLGAATIRGVATSGYEFDKDSSATTQTHARVDFWVGGDGLVREITVTIRASLPGNTPDPSADQFDHMIPPNPELQADRFLLEQSTPGGVPLPTPALDEFSSTLAVQFTEIGKARAVSAPQANRVESLIPPSTRA